MRFSTNFLIFSSSVQAATKLYLSEVEPVTKSLLISSSSVSFKPPYTGPLFIIPPSLLPGEPIENPKPKATPNYNWRIPEEVKKPFSKIPENPNKKDVPSTYKQPVHIPAFSSHGYYFSTDTVFSGDATYFYPNLGACGILSSISDYVVALSHGVFDQYTPGGNPNDNVSCGRKIVVFYGDKSVEVEVVDRLGGGGNYEISLSPVAFSKLADQRHGRIRVTWVWV